MLRAVQCGLLCLFAMGSMGVQAVERDVEGRLNQVMGDAKARSIAVAAGKRAAFFCENCHGATGNSPLDYVPNLAGQNPVYLLAQIDKFGDGRRKDEFMGGLVKVLKPEDRFNISVFYATQKVDPSTVSDAALVKAGRDHYARACVGCHGGEAKGTHEVARLAGQRAAYLINAMSDYRASKGTRADPRMTGVVKKLNDRQIQALATYLSSLAL